METENASLNKNVPVIPSSPAQEKGVVRVLASLQHRNYRLFWLGKLVSLFGTWMQVIGQAWLVQNLTHSAWQLGVVGALQALPLVPFSLFGGVFADRWPKRAIMLVTQTMAMLQALLLWILIVTGTIQIWHLYILALLLGITNCLDRPTQQAFIKELVGREDLPNAVALSSSLTQITRIVGPGLGGIIIAISGPATLFLLNALSFIAMIVCLLLIDSHALHTQAIEHRNTSTRHNTWQSLHEGITYVWKTPAVLWVIVVVGLVLLFGSNFNVVLPPLAENVLHAGATGFGFLSAATGIGALSAALWLAWGNQTPTIRSIQLGMLIFGIVEIVFALSRLYWLSVLLMACIGCAETAFAAQAITLLQTISHDHLRGRVMSVCMLFFDGSVPIGYLLLGWLSILYGISWALCIGALLSLFVLGIGSFFCVSYIKNR